MHLFTGKHMKQWIHWIYLVIVIFVFPFFTLQVFMPFLYYIYPEYCISNNNIYQWEKGCISNTVKNRILYWILFLWIPQFQDTILKTKCYWVNLLISFRTIFNTQLYINENSSIGEVFLYYTDFFFPFLTFVPCGYYQTTLTMCKKYKYKFCFSKYHKVKSTPSRKAWRATFRNAKWTDCWI